MKKFTSEDTGKVFVLGASDNTPTEQNLMILDFAIENGYGLAKEDLEIAWQQYKEDDDLPYYWYEELGMEVESAVEYLNTLCDDGVEFEFVDTDFMVTAKKEVMS